MIGGIPQGKPTQSTNRSKREIYHKSVSIPREEEKEERTPEAPEGDHHSPSSDDALSPQRKKQRSDGNIFSYPAATLQVSPQCLLHLHRSRLLFF